MLNWESWFTLNEQVAVSAALATALSMRYANLHWGWLGPGGLPGLQNRRRVARRAAMGSTPIHSRLSFSEIGTTDERIR